MVDNDVAYVEGYVLSEEELDVQLQPSLASVLEEHLVLLVHQAVPELLAGLGSFVAVDSHFLAAQTFFFFLSLPASFVFHPFLAFLYA